MMPAWDHSTLLEEPRPAAGGRCRREVPGASAGPARVKRLLSSEHFSVDGTLIEAWASMKSFQPEGQAIRRAAGAAGATPSATSVARRARNDTHASTTDPDARLYRKGAGMEAKLCFIGHALMENRSRPHRRCLPDARPTAMPSGWRRWP